MSFGKIGSWIDNKLNNVGSSWKGSTAKKTVDSIMEKSRQAVEGVRDSIEDKTEFVSDRLDAGLTRIENENPNATGFQKFMKVGMSGGFIGAAIKGDGKKAESEPPPLPVQPPVIEEKKNEPQQLELFDETNRGSSGKTLQQALEESDAGLIIIDPNKGTITQLGEPLNVQEKAPVPQESGGGFLKKAWDFGKQGGLVGYMNRKKAENKEEPAVKEKHVEQVDGFNLTDAAMQGVVISRIVS